LLPFLIFEVFSFYLPFLSTVALRNYLYNPSSS